MADVMGYFTSAILAIAFLAAFGAARKAAFAEAYGARFYADRSRFVVKPPRVTFRAGIEIAAFFGAIFVIVLVREADAPDYRALLIFFGGLCVIGVILLIYALRWRLTVAGDRLTLRPFFGKIRNYSLSDITHFAASMKRGASVYSGEKKLFSVGGYSAGSGALISYFIENGVRAPERIK